MGGMGMERGEWDGMGDSGRAEEELARIKETLAVLMRKVDAVLEHQGSSV